MRLSDQQKEQIRFNTEMFKLIVVLLFGTVGGCISFLSEGIRSARDVLFIAAGLIIATFCIIAGYGLFKATQNAIKDGKPE